MRASLFTICLVLFFSFSFAQSVEERVLEIRKEFKLINADKQLKKDSIEMMGETTEGGVLEYYSNSEGFIRKIVITYYRETGKWIGEYYLKEDKLFFVFNQNYSYNLPIYWTEKYAKENGMTEYFDYSKSTISENRYYFDKNESIIRWIDKDKNIIHDGVLFKNAGTEELNEYKKYIAEISKTK